MPRWHRVATPPEYLSFGHGMHAWCDRPSSIALDDHVDFLCSLLAPVISLPGLSSKRC